MIYKGLIVVFILLLIAWGLYLTGIVKLSEKVYDCSDVKSFQVINIKITDKFNPSIIDAYVCDHLNFIAGDNAGHWPAVGPHPSHTGYPGFDANRDLKIGESYEFVLNRSGTYTFHDHSHEEIVGFLSVNKEPRRGSPPDRP